MPCAARTGIVAASQPSSACAIQVTPALHQQLLAATPPRAPARGRGRAGPTRCSSASAPWPLRISRDSPPEVARSSPGSNWSTSVTAAPSRASRQASEAPNVPAPTTTALSTAARYRRWTSGGRPYPRIGRPPVGSSTLVPTTRASARLAGQCGSCSPVIALTFSAAAAPTSAGARRRRSARRGRAPTRALGRGAADRAAPRAAIPAAATTVLVVGSIHGTEPAGHAVVARLRRMRRAGRRAAPARSHGEPGRRRPRHAPERARRRPQPQLPVPLARRRAAVRHLPPGPAARRASRRRARCSGSIRRERPDVTLWYHQALRLVTLVPRADAGPDPRLRPPHRAARAACCRATAGTATSWQNRRFPARARSSSSWPPGRSRRVAADAHARAVLARAARAAPRPAAAGGPRPPIVWRPIPFGPERRRQMRAYSRRHYGDATAGWRTRR